MHNSLQAGLPKGLHSWLVGDGDEEQDPDEPPLFFESYYMTMNTLIEARHNHERCPSTYGQHATFSLQLNILYLVH